MPSDDVIPAAPCPQCKSPMAIAAEDFGFLVECPKCHAQFRARPDPTKVPEPPPPDSEQTTSRANRPRRRTRADYFDDRDEIAERRRRNRERDDALGEADTDFDMPERAPGQSARNAVAIVSFVFAGLLFLQASCLGLMGQMMIEGNGTGGPGATLNDKETVGLVMVLFSVWYLAGVGLMVPAGIGLLNHWRSGRKLGYLSAALGLLNAVSIVVLLIIIYSSARTTAASSSVVFILPFMLWVGYSITTLILLSKVRPLPKRGIENGIRG